MKQTLLRILKRIQPALVSGRLSPVFGFFYNALIHIELTAIRFFDMGAARTQAEDLTDLTAVIKTFERPQALARLVNSIRRFYPDLRILIVDDSAEPQSVSGTELITMPFDSGVSAGRQKALSHVSTEYLLLLDDDYIFYRKTDIASALQAIKALPDLDLLAGARIDLPLFNEHNYQHDQLYPNNKTSIYPAGELIGEFPVYDKMANFYIARTEKLRLVGWDPDIKRLDHNDFFTRAKGLITTAYSKELKCLHAKTPFDNHYLRFRFDIENDVQLINQKYFDNDRAQ